MIRPVKPTEVLNSIARRTAIRDRIMDAFSNDDRLTVTATPMGCMVHSGLTTLPVHLRDTGPRSPERLHWPDVIAVEVGERTGERRIWREARHKHTHDPKPLKLARSPCGCTPRSARA